MKNKDLIARLSGLDPELEVFAEDSVVTGAYQSEYDTAAEEGVPCIELDLMEFAG